MSTEVLVILITLVCFLALAALVLLPVHFFLEREQEVSKEWTEEKLAERLREHQASENGSDASEVDAAESPSS